MLSALGIVLAGYLGIGGLMFAFQRRLLYFPDRSRPEPAPGDPADMTAVDYVTADGLRLSGWYWPPAAPGLPVLVHFHGNAGHIGDRAPLMRPYLDAGFGLLLAEYRGYGGNPGRPTETGLHADARAALDFVAGQGVTPDRIVLYGESLGTGVAVRLAAESPVGALVLEAPFTSAADVGASAYPFVPVRLLMLDRFDSLRRIAAVTAPLLVLHGERDATVPVAHGRRLLAAARVPKEGRFYAEAGHTDLYDFGIAEEVITFLARHGLCGVRSGGAAVARGEGGERVGRIDIDQHGV
ncbi:MAG TPA: alpha/beta hydrolase [Alphaproteobacteria bacterium]|jgi:fermentation-respiration switch protein FrsA (DUF1100 family)|nr:alpha/beta hydrolase [Alphaproteobacteria bacterium]